MMINKVDVLNRIEKPGLVAVIRGSSISGTLNMVAALIEGGVMGIEITYSTPRAADVVKVLAERYDDQIC